MQNFILSHDLSQKINIVVARQTVIIMNRSLIFIKFAYKKTKWVGIKQFWTFNSDYFHWHYGVIELKKKFTASQYINTFN